MLALFERLRHTPVAKDLKKDAVYVLAAAVWWTLLREIMMRLLLRPVAAKSVVAVSPDEVASAKPPGAGSVSQSGTTTNGVGHTNGKNGTSNGTKSVKVYSNGRSRVLSARERRRLEHLQRRNETRFAEQGWSVMYYSCSFLVGLYISVHQPWWPFQVKEFWTDYPELTIDALLKYYYLAQTAFYVHQMFVLFSEARRKDHVQMFMHHLITIGLQGASYATNYHRVGVAIMLLLDPCDMLLSAAKMLRYVGYQTLCDVFFGLFLVAWLVFRHILFDFILYSAIVDVTLNPNADTSKGDYSTLFVTRSLIAMLAILQGILLIWFVMIVKVAWRVVTGSGAADTRSDDEDDDFEEEIADRREATSKDKFD